MLFYLQYILIQPQLMPVYSSSQMGLAAPPGTYTTLQERLYGGRCCLGKDLARACAESMYFSGSLYWQNNYSGQRVIYNCPPATGFLREDVGTNTAVPCTHTSTHTAAASLMNAEYSSDINSGFFFPRRSLVWGEKRTQLQPQSVHTSSKSLEASPQIAITSSWTHQNWQRG